MKNGSHPGDSCCKQVSSLRLWRGSVLSRQASASARVLQGCRCSDARALKTLYLKALLL